MTTDMASPVKTTSGHLWPPLLALAHYNITRAVPWLSARAGSAGDFSQHGGCSRIRILEKHKKARWKGVELSA